DRRGSASGVVDLMNLSQLLTVVAYWYNMSFMRRFPLLFAIAALAAAADPVKIVLVGDSTVNDGGGWGAGLRAALGPQAQIVNLALNGRSSKSFRDEGAWAPALAEKPQYVLIQFGHNDGPGKGPKRETDPQTTSARTWRAMWMNRAKRARSPSW